MTKATELAQLGGLVDVTGTGNATKVGIGTTVDITGGQGGSGNTSGGTGGSGIVIIAYPLST